MRLRVISIALMAMTTASLQGCGEDAAASHNAVVRHGPAPISAPAAPLNWDAGQWDGAIWK
jgi:hypothetical protein